MNQAMMDAERKRLRQARKLEIRRPKRWHGPLSQAARKDPEKVATFIEGRIDQGKFFWCKWMAKAWPWACGEIDLYNTRGLGIKDSVARKALHLLNLRGLISKPVHSSHFSAGTYREDVYLIRAKGR